MIIASRNWRLLINVWFIFGRVHQHSTGTCKTTMGFSFWSKFNDLEARKNSFFSFSLRYKYGLCTNTTPSYLIQQTNLALLYSRLWLTINVTTHYSILFNNFSSTSKLLFPCEYRQFNVNFSHASCWTSFHKVPPKDTWIFVYC